MDVCDAFTVSPASTTAKCSRTKKANCTVATSVRLSEVHYGQVYGCIILFKPVIHIVHTFAICTTTSLMVRNFASLQLMALTLNNLCRWSQVITHVPCGGSPGSPAGRLLISSTLGIIDGVEGVLGFAGPTNVWADCPSISLKGSMTFDIADIVELEEEGRFEGVIIHEMGHVIGFG